MHFWTRISNIGARPDDSPEDIRKIHLINRMIFLSSWTTLTFVPYVWFIGHSYYPAIQFLTGVLSTSSYLWMRRRHFMTALLWLYTTILLNVFYASIELPGSGVEYFLAPLSMIPFTVVEDRRITIGLALVCMAVFFASWVIQPYYTPHDIIEERYVAVSFVLILTTVFALCMIIMVQFSLTSSKYEQIIKNQKAIVEHKNKEITDSINYAKRIQDAKLPQIADLGLHLPESFILFKPKDIVSGDFYHFRQKNGQVFVAAADCTGHGVPGAFMSLIGMEKLNEAIDQHNNTDSILAHLNKGIKTSLKQNHTQEATRDGMDIALCAVEPPQRRLTYSGANRPLWIIRKDRTEVEEIKATKNAIGGLTSDAQEFARHEVNLHPGDTFYLFSDGYADQFSGTTGKKLMTKKLKDLLLEIQSMTMAEQKIKLDRFIETWKSGAEQVDDILVIGVRM